MRHYSAHSATTALLILTAFSCVLSGAGFAGESPVGLPAGFRYIGHYQLNSKLRVEKGEAIPVVIAPLHYHVYSDGIDVRVYCRVSDEDSYSTYGIYRSDGIGVPRRSGEIDWVAGVQAYSTKGEMIRQISVTRNSLTMIKTPPRSHRVIITRAVAVSKRPDPTSVRLQSEEETPLSLIRKSLIRKQTD